MSTSQAKIPKWVATIIILLVIAFVIYAVLMITGKKSETAGCFTFNDGTTQGWTIDQLYDIDITKAEQIAPGMHEEPFAKISYEPFKLSSEGGLLKAHASTYQVTDSTVENCVFYFISPDLSDNAVWQDAAGFRFDITRNFTSTSDDWYNHKVFAEILVENGSGEEVILFENFVDEDKKTFLTIPRLGIPYIFRCIPTELLENNNYIIKQLRIGCIMIGFNYNPNTEFNGSWEITNICPVYEIVY